ncbi:MAG: hypothetical protein JNK04_19740 [Myxococcales bacterium]|nr:hypothetical protein [Myxococcales bacterium]
MAYRALSLLFALTAVACTESSSGELGGAGGGGGSPSGNECPPDQTLVYNGDTLECGGFVEDTRMPVHDDFASCAEPPNSSCALPDFCAQMGCGDPNAMFDASGCRRRICETNEDCDAGQVCITTHEEDTCLSNAGFACGPIDGEACVCYANLICGSESHCVDE